MLWRKSAPASSCACYSHARGGFGLWPMTLVSLPEPSWELIGARQQLNAASGCGGVSCDSTLLCSASVPRVTRPLPCQHLGPCILRLCTHFFNIHPQKIFPCWYVSGWPPWNTRSKLSVLGITHSLLDTARAEGSRSPTRCQQTAACTKCLCLSHSWGDSYLERIHFFHFSVRFLHSVR